MINNESLKAYHHSAIMRGDNSLIVAPHQLLRQFIANYTFTDPRTMPEQQTVLPSASSTLVYSVGYNRLIDGLRGVNTKPAQIADYARRFDFLFLIEFHPAGLYPFIKIDQNLLLNNAFSFEELSRPMNQEINEAYMASNDIDTLKHRLDRIFLSKLDSAAINPAITFSMNRIIASHGLLRSGELAGEVFYSEKQLNRLFHKQIGTGIKTFSRIVRMKHAADLLKHPIGISQLAEMTGHYDPSHFVRDFKDVYGITPMEYTRKMSIFYNDPFKLGRYNG